MRSSAAQVALVFALTLGLALCVALAALVVRTFLKTSNLHVLGFRCVFQHPPKYLPQVRLCWTSRRPGSPRRELSPSHLDLDNDAIDYDLACHQLQPLPPPKLMVTMMV